MNNNTDLTSFLQSLVDTNKISYEGLPDRPGQEVMFTRLSELTTKVMERHYAKLARKKRGLRERKPYTRKKGTRHWKTKQATAKRQYEKRWAKEPFSCIVKGYGRYHVDKKLFDELVLPLWKEYNPAELKLRKYSGYGTKEKPHTMWTFDIIHTPTGRTVYNGNDMLIYRLSTGSNLEA